MKKFLLILTVILLCLQQGHAQQQRQTWTEDFDGASPPAGWTVSSSSVSGYWQANTTYHQSASSSTNPQSYRGKLPNNPGDSIILTTPVYDCTNYEYVFLRFDHICKVSPNDVVRLEYNLGGTNSWEAFPWDTYLGSATNYRTTGFNAASYPEWQANDSTVFPTQSWWKKELFDLSIEVGWAPVQFRFVIKHGALQGTQRSYGWLLDNFQVLAATYQVYPPTVEFIAPFIKDTVYGTGPWEINAKVKTNTNAPIEIPWLKYTATYNGTLVESDSILMTHVQGDSLWKASIKQFIAGTEVLYSVEGFDTNGNYAMANSGYIVTIPPYGSVVSDYIYFGAYDTAGGTGNTAIIIYSGYTNSWSRHLYLNSELEAINTSIPTLINSIAYKTTGLSSSNRTNIRIYMKATTQTTQPQSYINPVSDGATLVYQGPMNFVYPDWIDLQFTGLPFLLPAGSNLMVYVEDDTPSSGSYTWRGENSIIGIANMTVYGTSYLTGSFSAGARKPVTRLGMGNLDYRNNSVSTHSIDIDDTLIVSPGNTIAVVATIKNKGSGNLDSVTISYSVNGANPVSKNLRLNPAMPWDFNYQDTLGYYNSKINGFDTILVWVSNPNGTLDNVTSDDTLTKFIYGSSDIVMAFVDPPADTVYRTGPYEITAKIYTLSGTPVGPVSLFVVTTLGGITNYDTLPMVSGGNNLWTATIPQKVFGSNVVYSVSLTDILNNNVKVIGNYYIKRLSGGAATGYVIVGTGTVTNNQTAINLYYNYSYTRQLYLGSELTHTGSGGMITKLAWDYAYTGSWNYTNQTCYIKAVDDNVISANNYVDPLTDGATLVWQGSIGATAPGWVEITLDQPFLLPPGKNLLVYWNHQDGSYPGSAYVWNHTSTSDYLTITGYSDGSFSAATTMANRSYNRPNARFYLTGVSDLESSVALDLINSPENISVMAGTSTPVQVTIRNKGMQNLDSCLINWTLNGQLQLPATTYYGELPEDFTDTITIGSYIPTAGKRDTLTVWVSMPNGVVDSTTYDDTLTITPIGCSRILSGVVTVGEGGDYATLEDVLSTIRNCGVMGNITLRLKGVFTENLDLSNVSGYMQGHTLTISSYDNHPDSAIISVSSGVALTLNKSYNIEFRNITIDATSGTNAVLFSGECSDIEFYGCNIKASPTATASTSCAVRAYASSSTPYYLKRVKFIKNNISGGYYNFYFYYTYATSANLTATPISDGVVIDSNNLTDAYYYGIYAYYYNAFRSISNNTVISRSSSGIYYGINIYYYNNIEKMLNNKVTITSTSTAYGINLYYYLNNYMQVAAPALVANNEVRITGTTNSIYGMRLYGSNHVNAYHNSIYAKATTGAIHGLTKYPTSTAYQVNAENNLVYVETGGAGYPFYSASTTYVTPAYGSTNYNNYYSTGPHVGYIATPITTMAALQTASGQDANSVNVSPDFIDVNNDLNLMHDVGLMCPRIALVPEDISGVSRIATTSMGCYAITPLNGNGMLKEITGLTDGINAGQTENVGVVVYNTGTSPLTNINLGWSVNGVPRGNANYTVNLQRGDSTTITVGNITYPSSNVAIKVWINNLNNGSLADLRREDDTVSTYINVCMGAYSGRLTVGPGGMFSDMEALITGLDLCGISGDITAALMPGTYEMNVNLSNNSTLFGNHKLTITSSTGDADSVAIQPSSGAGIIMNNTNNIEIRAITIDAATSGTYGVQFTGAASNITIRDCKILANDTMKTTGYAAIYKASSTGALDGLAIKNNILDGGYYNIYLYGSSSYNTKNIVIDSNTMSNSYYYGAYLYYVSLLSTSYNKVTTRSSYEGATWYGLYFYYARNGGNIIGNRVYADNSGINTTLYGMRTYYIDSAVVANNEIYLNSSASSTYGMYAYYHKEVSYVYNTVLIEGGAGSTFRAAQIYIPTSSSYSGIYKNNIFIATGDTTGNTTTPYAIYLSSNPNSYTQYNEIGYNNYYSTGDLGYAGGARANLTAWDTTVIVDSTSVNIFPQFVNVADNLELTTVSFNNDSLFCRPVPEVGTDMKGYFRSLVTPTMGAYERPPASLDLMAWEVYLTEYEAVNNQDIAVHIDVLNTGGVSLTNATFGWSVNGQVISTTVSRNFSPSLAMYQRSNNISIGTFQASGNIGEVIEVVVWVQTVNGMADTINWNDTVSITYKMIPLAEFVNVIDTTTGSLSFDVLARIYEGTGAPLTTPELYMETIMDNSSCYIHNYDTIPMTLQDGLWVATIPAQYYNSKVIYKMYVSDNVGNNVVLMDSTYIEFGHISIDPIVDIKYIGDIQTITLPKGVYDLECWGAQGGDGMSNSPTAFSTNGGRGGYSKGTITLSKPTTIFICVGGAGVCIPQNLNNSAEILPGGYNGGGHRSLSTSGEYGSSGGGATHIATAPGVLSSLSSNQSAVLIVAGGGGGHGEDDERGGAGGGIDGILGAGQSAVATAGTQTGGGQNANNPAANGLFGQGGNTIGDGGGGGGGWYGGASPSGSETLGADGGGGSGGSGYISPLLSNAQTIVGDQSFSSPAGIAETGHNGDGYVRITTISGGGSGDVYPGNDLAIFNLISPVNTDDVCANTDSPVEIELSNVGENDYDFTIDNITIGYEIIDPKWKVYQGNITMDTGQLLSGDSRIIELIPPMAILGGIYTIKAWVTSVIDNFVCDDTLTCTFKSGKIGLPLDENFSNAVLPFDFMSHAILGEYIWQPCPDTNSQVRAVFGTGMLRYRGDQGTMARLSTRQIDLQGAVNPRLELWYYHDTTASGLDDSYTDVNIAADGDTATVLSLLRASSVHGWKQYIVDLSPYTGAQCVLIQFESMSGLGAQSAQYIDRIFITSDQDMEVSDIIITPNITVCDLTNKELKVVLRTTMNQAIDFSRYPTSLAVDVSGYPTFDYPLQGILKGNTSDTILIASGIDLMPGISNIRAYLTAPVDNHAPNDTANLSLDIHPEMSVTAQAVSGGTTSCLAKGAQIQQEAKVKNTGNVAIFRIELLLNVIASSQQTLTKSIDSLNPGDSAIIFFDAYTVPPDADYQVQITGYMGCDSALVNSSTSVTECVDINDLAIIQFLSPDPLDGGIDQVGSAKEIEVSLTNTSDMTNYQHVDITALIEDEDGQVLAKHEDVIPVINALESNKLFKFLEKYTVPDEEVYYVRVFISKVDNYQENDTIREERSTEETGLPIGKSNIFTMEQNIPNPTDNSTIIRYSVPESGNVIFHIRSMNGQLLYNKVIQSEPGINSIEVNTSGLSAGIYMYSMEYKNQRIVKRMIIKR